MLLFLGLRRLDRIIPVHTERQTWLRIYSRAPTMCSGLLPTILQGKITGPKAIDFVLSDHAHFVLSDCGERARLGAGRTAVLMSELRVGCAPVYVIRSGP